MQIRTPGPHISGLIASVEGTFEDAYAIALHFWSIAGNEGVHMDGLEIWEDDGSKPLLCINYCTHER